MSEKARSNGDNDILERFRQTMQSPTEADNDPIEKDGAIADTPDEIVKKLKAQLGGSTSEQTAAPESEYDISGFEIEEETEIGSVDEEEPLLAQETAPKIDLQAEQQAADVDVLAQDEEHLSAAEENDREDIAFEDAELSVEEESDVSAEEQEEARRRVALFVEKTVNPEEDFDYFAEMERIAAKRRDSATATEQSLPSDESKDEAAEEDPITLVEEETILITEEETTEVAETISITETSDESAPMAEANEDPRDDLSESAYLDHSPNAFFFESRARAEKTTEKLSQEGNNQGAERLDDTDINLLLALGKKDAIEDSVGFVRVREAKNNFYDPMDEEPIVHKVFAYDGQEFRSYEQTETIKQHYREERKLLFKRMIGTFVFAALLLFVESVVALTASIPFVSDLLSTPLSYFAINFLITIGGLLLSGREILIGLRGFFTMRPNQYTPLSILCMTVTLYNVLLVSAFRNSGLPTYNSVLMVFLATAIVGDAIRLNKERITFEIISTDKEKFSLEKSDSSPALFHEKKTLHKRDLLVERVSFVGRYFTRTARRPSAYTNYFAELLIVQIFAIFAGILAAFVSKDVSYAFHMYTLVLLVCIPVQSLVYDICAFHKLSKFLSKHESAIIGETADKEYVGANTVYLDDIEMFGHLGVSLAGLRVYDEKQVQHILYLASSVFSKIEGPLRHVLESTAADMQKSENVVFETLPINGIVATVDSEYKVLFGTDAFMQTNGLYPKQNGEDDKKVAGGEFFILHMAVNGSLCAKIYLKYAITQRFEKFVTEMKENGTKVGIRTLDPNVTEKTIALMRGDAENEISVVRPTLNDLVPLGRRSDSSIITAKSPHMISLILAKCVRLKKVRTIGSWLRLASALVGWLALIALILLSASVKIPALLVALYQLIWLIPAVIYIKINLK